MSDRVLAHLRSQIVAAGPELAALRPIGIDWPTRCAASAEAFASWLSGQAANLRQHVSDVLNAPRELRRLWAEIRPHVDIPSERLAAYERQLAFDDILQRSVTGESVSAVVIGYLLEHPPISGIRSNGRSDYPDLYLANADYSILPTRTRKRRGDAGSAEVEFGPASVGLAGQRRPVRVPDGLEIKTCLRAVRVDCHHPHPGLHLVLVYREADGVFAVEDIRLGFLRAADYRESERNTTATTVKYSFGGDAFVSLFPV